MASVDPTGAAQGCVRNKPLSCKDKLTEVFVKFEGLKVPDTTHTWLDDNMGLEECRVKCLNNYSCMAYSNSDIRGGGFHHMPATFIAMFHILSCSHLKPLLLNFLDTLCHHLFHHRVVFHDILVLGYAIAGKPHSYHVFGALSFDLDTFTYHVLLDSFVDQNYLNSFDVIVRQIYRRGFQTHFTNVVIIIKHLCKERRLEEAEEYLCNRVCRGDKLQGPEVSLIVAALCESFRFDCDLELVRQFGSSSFGSFRQCLWGLDKGSCSRWQGQGAKPKRKRRGEAGILERVRKCSDHPGVLLLFHVRHL
ncbi:hypothetical protein Fmac_021338 [Flemingia macrophylla]|uniref:Apple domain-containing protein n=1 Tax=Flemingia macrophylla TaxID=520843 RepID=A0ABD1LWJ8_9FABA